MMCVSCRRHVDQWTETTGESGLYSPNQPFLLCELCFDVEYKLIDDHGTNDIPSEVARYRANLWLGELRRSA